MEAADGLRDRKQKREYLRWHFHQGTHLYEVHCTSRVLSNSSDLTEVLWCPSKQDRLDKMAKLVAVCRDEADFAFERRQIPLNIEDTLTVLYIVAVAFWQFISVNFAWSFLSFLAQMVMEIPETVISTRQVNEDELQVFNKVSE